MLKDTLLMAIRTIFSNKMRSMLSMLGIIIGVFTIILVFAIGQGAQTSIEEQYKNLSVTTIMVMPITSEGAKSKVSADDVEFILNEAEYISEATPLIQGKLPIAIGDNSSQFTILGVEENFQLISNLNLIQGAFLTDKDTTKARKIVLGYGIFEEFFELTDKVVGKEIVIAKKTFDIIGVLEPSGATVGPISYDDSVFIPYTTADKVVLGTNGTIRLITLASDIDAIGIAMSELSYILREAHKLKSADPDDFRLKDQGSKVVAAQESAKTMSLLLTTVATIVLIVSGIGIMNVMFAGVAERTKEIGILKSIGAKKNNILRQFLIESIILTLISGIIGAILGEIIVPLVDGYEGIMLIRSTFGTVLAVGFSIFVGVFFGFYPAYNASKLDPVDALRL